MRHGVLWVTGFTLILCGMVLGASRYQRVPEPKCLTGMEDFSFKQIVPPRHNAPTLDDTLVGSQYLMGTTWYDYQQNGTAGKQIVVTPDGWVQVAWMNGVDAQDIVRRIYFNAWDPTSHLTSFDGGVQIDNAPQRAGFASLAVNRQGYGCVAYHQILNQAAGDAHSAAGIDYLPNYGLFSQKEIPHLDNNAEIIWPHIDVDRQGYVHTVSTDYNAPGLHYYARGVPYFSTQNHGDSIIFPKVLVAPGDSEAFQSLGDSNTFITADIATALHSDRVAMSWIYNSVLHPYVGPNVFLKVSEDGGINWGETQNVTNLMVIDTNCIHDGGTQETCNIDTMRPQLDVSLLFDQDDNIHVAFTTESWFYWNYYDDQHPDSAGPWSYTAGQSNIWHWDEQHRRFSLMAEAWYGADPSTYHLPQNLLMCSRPNLSVDTLTGRLYCAYQLFDTAQWSNTGYLMSDAFMTVSTNGGLNWAVGTDVTQSYGGQNTAPPDSKSERDITIAKFVSNNAVHMFYTLDHDAGCAVFEQGAATLNEQYYLRIPVDSIPTSPLMPERQLRSEAVTERPVLKPGQFALYQNYPNPFNPTTTIQFDLAAETMVSLRVFDVLGRQVTTLLDKQRLSGGVQLVPFDASALASGVYFYRLETPKMTQTKKMIVMK